jgi:hypothetical protein
VQPLPLSKSSKTLVKSTNSRTSSNLNVAPGFSGCGKTLPNAVILSPAFWGEGSAFRVFKQMQVLRRLLAPQNDDATAFFRNLFSPELQASQNDIMPGVRPGRFVSHKSIAAGLSPARTALKGGSTAVTSNSAFTGGARSTDFQFTPGECHEPSQTRIYGTGGSFVSRNGNSGIQCRGTRRRRDEEP